MVSIQVAPVGSIHRSFLQISDAGQSAKRRVSNTGRTDIVQFDYSRW